MPLLCHGPACGTTGASDEPSGSRSQAFVGLVQKCIERAEAGHAETSRRDGDVAPSPEPLAARHQGGIGASSGQPAQLQERDGGFVAGFQMHHDQIGRRQVVELPHHLLAKGGVGRYALMAKFSFISFPCLASTGMSGLARDKGEPTLFPLTDADASARTEACSSRCSRHEREPRCRKNTSTSLQQDLSGLRGP